jgi:hypothetical protein
MSKKKPTDEQPPPPDPVEALLDTLFTAGNGEQAHRLVLTSQDGRDLGGWGRPAVREAVLKYARPLLAEVQALRAALDSLLDLVDNGHCRMGPSHPLWQAVAAALAALTRRGEGA